MDVADLFVALTISNQPVAGSIILTASRDYVMAGVLIINGMVPPDPQTMTQGYNVEFCYFRWENSILLTFLFFI
jgi:hypothetical protein